MQTLVVWFCMYVYLFLNFVIMSMSFGSVSSGIYVTFRKAVSLRKLMLPTCTLTMSSPVADNLGFPDVSSFSRYFKREEGISPSEWRDSMQHNAIGGMERLF